MESEPESESTRLFRLLLKAGWKPKAARELEYEIQNMANANLISQFGTKLDAKLEALNSKHNLLVGLFSALLALMALLVTLNLIQS